VVGEPYDDTGSLLSVGVFGVLFCFVLRAAAVA